MNRGLENWRRVENTNGLQKEVGIKKWWGRLMGEAFLMVMFSSTSFGQSQVLKNFDLDTKNDIGIDVLMSEGPPNREWGRTFEPLMVDPTFTPSLLSNQSLHLVSRATEPTLFDGAGTISISGLSEDSIAAFVGQGELPKKTGVTGLTRLTFGQPTPFRFTKGARLFIYYITIPDLSNTSFGQLFGNGSRPILSLSKAAETLLPAVTQLTKTTSTPSVKPTSSKLVCQTTSQKAKIVNPPKKLVYNTPCHRSKSCKIKGPLDLLKEAIQKTQTRQHTAKLTPKPHGLGSSLKKRPALKSCSKPRANPIFRIVNLGGL
jgi:hypothetical protein